MGSLGAALTLGHSVWPDYDAGRAAQETSTIASKGPAGIGARSKQARAAGEEDDDGYQEECESR